MPIKMTEAEAQRILGDKYIPPAGAPPKPAKPPTSGKYSYEEHPGGGYSIWTHKDGLVYLTGCVATIEEAKAITRGTKPQPINPRKIGNRRVRNAIILTVISWIMGTLVQAFRAFTKRPPYNGTEV